MGRAGATLLVGAIAAVVIASAILAFRVRRVESSPSRRLAEVVGAHRVVRARLTGGFAYAPCDTAPPNDSLISGLICEHARPDQWREIRALAQHGSEMRAATANSEMAATDAHARGLWYVVWGNADAATRELRAAARADPSSAVLQSDLGAALLQHAEATQDAISLLDAFVAVDSATVLDPQLAEAAFNRAVVLEQLSLRAPATAQWERYLQLDSRSLWADEARAHLRRLHIVPQRWDSALTRLTTVLTRDDAVAVDGIVRQFPWRARTEARAMLTAWARAREAHRPHSDTLLHSALRLGESLARVTGDRQAVDVARAIATAETDTDSARVSTLARGFNAYDIGRRHLGVYALDSAALWFERARRAFEAAGNAALYWVNYDLAQVPYQRHDATGYSDALNAFDRVYTSTPNAYRVTRGLAARSKGLIQTAVRVNYDAAIAAYAAAVREGQGTGEPGLELRPRVILASLYHSLRGERVAWTELYAAMRAGSRRADAADDAQRIAVMAAELSRSRHPSVALMFQAEAVRLAEQIGNPLLMITGLTQEAELLGRAGRSALAFERVRRAHSLLARIESDSIQAVMSASIDLVDAGIWLRVRPDSALRVAHRVVTRHRERQQYLVLDRAYLALADAHVALGQMDSAQLALEAALRETERRRGLVSAGDDRAGLLDRTRPVIDRLVRFLVDRADTVGAFEFVERMRGRVLLERVDGAATSPRMADRPSRAARRGLAHSTSIVSYVVLGDEVVTWLVRRDTIRMYRGHVSGSLEELVGRFSTSITASGDAREAEKAAGELYGLLVAPFVGVVPRGSRLVFIPDKWLHFVPFAALRDLSGDRFLVESFEIGVAPSLELYARSADRYAQLDVAPAPAVLAVGNPTFDRRVVNLPPLPGAEREAIRAASHYARARTLLGSAATPASFLREAVKSDVVHFAGHGVVRSDAPLLSHLVLAADATRDAQGSLYARELYKVTLPRTRLAVLSGCQTAEGRLSDTEGASSLARALFATGVPAVVASLWAIQDEPTADFFDSYHGALSMGADPTAALRATQLAWLAKGQDPWANVSVWAAFQLFGATTDRASLVRSAPPAGSRDP